MTTVDAADLTFEGSPGDADARRARCELIRVLGALAITTPPASEDLCVAAGLPAPTAAEHTGVFVLSAPPFASVHLGAEGGLGGEALDRVEGFWRALGQTPPQDADHLGVLLLSYAHLAEAALSAPAAARAAETLLHEHIRSFAPGYLTAVATLGIEAVTDWAELTLEVLADEPVAMINGPAALPLALRMAPDALEVTCDLDELLDAMVAPVRSGIVLTQRELAIGADRLGVGYRRGERRFALKAMMTQDKPATLAWLAEHSSIWAQRHRSAYGDNEAGRWWAHRAASTTDTLTRLLQEVA